jgi:hypothetical protein
MTKYKSGRKDMEFLCTKSSVMLGFCSSTFQLNRIILKCIPAALAQGDWTGGGSVEETQASDGDSSGVTICLISKEGNPPKPSQLNGKRVGGSKTQILWDPWTI